MEQLLLRRRDAARILGASERQLLKWERSGLLHPINLKPTDANIRAVRYSAAEIRELAERFMRAGQEACA